MSALHVAFAAAYPLLRLRTMVASAARPARTGRLRVLLYHDISPWDEGAFEEQLRWIASRWRFITPAVFAEMVNGREAIKGDNVLLTFDDGYGSNLTIANKILAPLGIHALFFVVPHFVALTSASDQKHFIATRIKPGTDLQTIPFHLRNMGWSDLASLLDSGHTIGAHTASHARLSGISSADELEAEIVGGADILEKKLRIRVRHFAYTFGDLPSFTPAALSIARRRFDFVHSGLRGQNPAGTSPFAIRRDALQPADPHGLVGSFLEGGADFLYARSLSQLDSWTKG